MNSLNYLHAFGMNKFYVKSILLLIAFFTSVNLSAQLAFPTASGAGAYVSGGRGGTVIHVTNLNDSGPGSFREAFETPGTRIIVFDVSGTINCLSSLSTAYDNVTIAGQTAPEGGITFTGNLGNSPIFEISGRNNMIFRHIRVRPVYYTGGSNADSFQCYSCTNVIVDHCSVSWGGDECLSFTGNTSNITIQNSIIAESKTGSIIGNPSNPQNAQNLSMLGNLFFQIGHRHPNTPTNGRADVINNVIYGYRYRINRPANGYPSLNEINNYYITDTARPLGEMNKIDKESVDPQIYSKGNLHLPSTVTDPSLPNNNDTWTAFGSSDGAYAFNYNGVSYYDDDPAPAEFFVSTQHPLLGHDWVILSALESLEHVKTDVGANKTLNELGVANSNLDDVDDYYITNVNNGNLLTVNSPFTMAGKPHYQAFLSNISTTPINIRPSDFDTDNDGMPNEWEISNGLNVNDPSDRNIVQPDGYTNLEYYLNGMMLDPTDITANAGEDVSICEGEEVVLTATGGATYEWSTGETTQSITVSPAETTIYTVTVFDESGSNSDQDDVAVTVNAIPEANAGEDVSVCFGNSITLTASGGSTYLWSTGETTESITVSPSETTIYSVEVFENNCSSSDEVLVTVSELPIINAGEDVTINLGESITLTASGGDTYLWDTDEASESITVSPIETTTYTVTGFVADCEASDTVTVTVVDNSVVADAGEDVSICEGEEVVLTATGGATYEWSTGETTQSITVSPTETIIYTVTVFDESGSNSDQDDVAVTVNAYPIANAGEDVSVCLGNSITLTASGGSTYLWSTGETTESITVSPSETTIYSVEVFENDCSSIDEVMVTVNEIPTVDAGSNVTISLGESTTLTAFGADTYLWSTGETTQSITVSPTETSTYSVTGFINGCENTDTVTVFLQGSNVVADAGEDVSICEGEQVVLTATGGETYEWSTGETTQSITVSPSETTTYTVTVFDESGSNSDFDDVTVTVNTLPEIDAGTDVTIYTGESTTLTATGADTYLWNTGATTQSITVSPVEATTYSVTGFTNGCEASDSVVVFVEDLVIANAGDDVSICQGYETVLTASGGDSYLWSTGATTQSITVSPNSTSTYSVIAYVGNQQDEDEVTVTVNPNPNVIIQNGDEVMILQGDYITLSATGANSYQWSNGATLPNIAVNPSVTTTYSVTGFINNCEDEKQITVNVLEEVTAVVDVEQNEICLGETVTLTASGGDEYLWSTGDTTESITVSPEESLEYSVTVFNALDFDETSVIVSVVDCSSIETPDEPEEFDFLVYQDPQTDVLKVRVSGYQSVNVNNMSIFDITGKHVFSIDFEEEDESTVIKEIDTSSFSRGIYIIRLIYDDKALVKKIPIR
ncbi:T9SS type A sorting domain-containing protein [Flavobacteriaceae bacterium 144Ye]|nr:T9SS type A sorting domain-containing protein [Flavobacteriaceae bacterium 144Ye]